MFCHLLYWLIKLGNSFGNKVLTVLTLFYLYYLQLVYETTVEITLIKLFQQQQSCPNYKSYRDPLNSRWVNSGFLACSLQSRKVRAQVIPQRFKLFHFQINKAILLGKYTYFSS